jgi:hypothetical protein
MGYNPTVAIGGADGHFIVRFVGRSTRVLFFDSPEKGMMPAGIQPTHIGSKSLKVAAEAFLAFMYDKSSPQGILNMAQMGSPS